MMGKIADRFNAKRFLKELKKTVKNNDFLPDLGAAVIHGDQEINPEMLIVIPTLCLGHAVFAGNEKRAEVSIRIDDYAGTLAFNKSVHKVVAEVKNAQALRFKITGVEDEAQVAIGGELFYCLTAVQY